MRLFVEPEDSKHFALVVYRDEVGDAPAILVSRNDDGIANLLVFDTRVVADYAVARVACYVPRGNAERTEALPSWYEVAT